MGQKWPATGAGALGAADLGVAYVLLEEAAINPTREPLSRRTYTGLGKQTPGGHRQNLACTRTQEKGAVTAQETDPDSPRSAQKSPAEAWVGLLQGWGH